MKHLTKYFLLIYLCFFCATQAKAITVYLKPAEALKIAFPNALISVDNKVLTEEQKLALEKQIGKISKTDWIFSTAKVNGQITGYALVDSEIGKTEPITFMTIFNTDGSVKNVEILVYREPYGSQVTQKSFLNQFNSKTIVSPLKLGGDINNVTGATYSSKGMTKGIKRALALWNLFYGKK